MDKSIILKMTIECCNDCPYCLDYGFDGHQCRYLNRKNRYRNVIPNPYREIYERCPFKKGENCVDES